MKASEFIASLREQANIIRVKVENEFLPLSHEALNGKENPDRWSMLECFEHLNRYNHYYLAEIKRSLAAGTANSDNNEIRSTWMGKMSINMMRPENQKKQKTFARMNPANSTLDRSVLETFLRDQHTILDLLQNAASIGLNKKRVRLEFFKLLTITSAEALEFVIVHEQRHLRQALNVKKALIAHSPVLAV